MSDRAAAPVLGAVLLLAVTVIMAAGVGAVATSMATPGGASASSAAFTCAASPDGEVRVTHRGGAAIDPAALRVRVRVDGRRLAHQPPVPFFAATGFESGPTGPFNRGYRGSWRAGETAAFRIASTNRPTVSEGATVEVRLYLEDRRIAALETTA